jgi:hypothetical protein
VDSESIMNGRRKCSGCKSSCNECGEKHLAIRL